MVYNHDKNEYIKNSFAMSICYYFIIIYYKRCFNFAIKSVFLKKKVVVVRLWWHGRSRMCERWDYGGVPPIPYSLFHVVSSIFFILLKSVRCHNYHNSHIQKTFDTLIYYCYVVGASVRSMLLRCTVVLSYEKNVLCFVIYMTESGDISSPPSSPLFLRTLTQVISL